MEVFPILLVHVVGRCGGRPGGVGVAVDARSGGGGVSPPAAQRPPNWLYCFELVRESLLDSYKNKSHKYLASGLATERK